MIYIHFIHESSGNIVAKRLVSYVPRVNDEVRLGGKNNEHYYKVTLVVWVYDENKHPYERVNIGVVKLK